MAIMIDNIHKVYNNGSKALKGISLEIERGTFTAILGSSGAGKSTLLRSINGLETPTSGNIFVSGMQVTGRNLRIVRADAAMVFQDYNLANRLTVMTNVLTGRLSKRHPLLSLIHLFSKEDFSIASEALARVGLAEKSRCRADKLSSEQQQRIGIARALAQNSSIILADEPAASLNPLINNEILSLLRGIARERNITIIASLHQVEFAREYADRIIGLNTGRVVFDDSVEKLTAKALERIYRKQVVMENGRVQMEVSYA